MQLYEQRYARMRSGIVAHGSAVSEEDVEQLLSGLDFVFVAIDDTATRQWLLPALDALGVAFVDVGIGVEKIDERLLGIVRTSFGETPRSRASPREGGGAEDIGEYARNVQIVELNALNAALAGDSLEEASRASIWTSATRAGARTRLTATTWRTGAARGRGSAEHGPA